MTWYMEYEVFWSGNTFQQAKTDKEKSRLLVFKAGLWPNTYLYLYLYLNTAIMVYLYLYLYLGFWNPMYLYLYLYLTSVFDVFGQIHFKYTLAILYFSRFFWSKRFQINIITVVFFEITNFVNLPAKRLNIKNVIKLQDSITKYTQC